jgi:hypothetical protein
MRYKVEMEVVYVTEIAVEADNEDSAVDKVESHCYDYVGEDVSISDFKMRFVELRARNVRKA